MIGRSMVPTYLRYIVPSMIAFTLTSIYGIVDGLFVGNVVGDAGLAGINVSFPLVQFVFAEGTGIGMGGAVISSIRAGRGDEASSRRAVGNTLLMLVVASLPLMAVLLMFGAPLSELLGGRGATLAEAVNYITVIAWGTPFLVLQVGCLPLIRNRGHVNYAMGVSVLSGLVNVALDWLFVVELHAGTAGAAAATVIAQALAFALCAAFFLRKGERIALRDFKPQARTIGHALKLGMAPFGLTLLPEVTVVAVNMNAVVQGGEVAVAAYAVISYTAMIIQMLIQGVGDGSQPLVSRSYGAGRYAEARAIRTTNYVITVTIGVLGLAAMYLLREQVPAWFGASADTTQLIAFALPVFSLSYVFYGFTHASTSYFYATDNAVASSTIVYGEAALVAMVVTGLGTLFGLNGIWASVSVVQAVLSMLAFGFLRKSDHALSRRTSPEETAAPARA